MWNPIHLFTFSVRWPEIDYWQQCIQQQYYLCYISWMRKFSNLLFSLRFVVPLVALAMIKLWPKLVLIIVNSKNYSLFIKMNTLYFIQNQMQRLLAVVYSHKRGEEFQVTCCATACSTYDNFLKWRFPPKAVKSGLPVGKTLSATLLLIIGFT